MITNTKKIKKNPVEFKSRKLNQNKLRLINESLSEINWEVLETLNTDDSYNKFEETLSAILDYHAPEKITRVKHTHILTEPWMTKGILTSSKRIYKLYTKCIKKTKGDPIYDKYIEQRNKLGSIKRKAKFKHYQTLINNYKSDSKRLWKTINELTGKCKNKSDSIDYININGIKTYNNENISNGFCEFFSNVGAKVATGIGKCSKDYKEYMTSHSTNSIYLYPTNRYEIEKIINNFKNKTSFGNDKISNTLIKSLKSEISYPLEIIFNKSITEGIFPNKFKLAHVLPIFKNNNKHEFTNYRPISLLTCLSKILEKIIHNRLYVFLEDNKLFSDLQFGFRKKLSTIDAITCFLTKLIPSLDKKEFNIGIFIDLSKAFDTIDHDILLYKLERLGIRGIAKTWFQDYLANRKQSVRINKVNSNDFFLSTPCNVTHGVPQGSILGPILFIIYISDMTNSLKHGTAISFADDTTLLIRNKSFEDLYIHAYEDLHSLIDYLNANKLSINLSKTKYILFKPNIRKYCNLNKVPDLIINNIEIKQVEYTKFLGIYIDSKLNWMYQVNNIINKLKQSLYIFNSTKSLLPISSKILLYHAHVVSHITYGTLLWGPMINNVQINKIKACINKIVTAIKNVKKINNYYVVYKELKILKFEDIIELELNKFMYKMLNNLITENIQNAFDNEPRHYNTRNRNIPRIAQHNTNLYNNSFMAKSAIMFTRLPEEIKNAKSLKLFSKYIIKLKQDNY
jgi:hypothetical protein